MKVSGGLGILVYAAFWILVPMGEPGRAEPVPRTSERHRAVALLVSVVALGMLVGWSGPGRAGAGDWVWPMVLLAAGGALLWRQADEAQRNRWLSIEGRGRPAALVRTGVGLALVGAGLTFFLVYGGGLGDAFAALRGGLLLLLGLVVIFGPYVVRLARELTAERRARIRAQERAEVAAHVHDSVLHTLTLIQRHVDDPREVARLARAQERELRAWLDRPEGEDPDMTFAAAVRRAAAQVEDTHGVPVEVVCVGDCPVDERLAAQVAAAREAMVNAAKYAADGGPIQVFTEVEEDVVTVYVRDRGPGFDLEAVPADRLGVRESVLGRMRRNGGTATVRSDPGEGTEIQLDMERQRR
jgi:signal transduction histidine kinase